MNFSTCLNSTGPGLPYVLTLMVASAVGLMWYFRKRGWLKGVGPDRHLRTSPDALLSNVTAILFYSDSANGAQYGRHIGWPRSG